MRALGFTVLLVGCSASDDVPAPLIAAVVPNHAPPGAVIVVTGDYFCQLPDVGNEDPTCESTGTVEFGTTPGTPSTWSDTEIMVEVPQGILGRADVSVVAAGRRSNHVEFVAE